MSWKGVTVMDQKVRFISEYLKRFFRFSELCEQFSISRKTGYKWVKRYQADKVRGLEDRSHRPHTCPHKTDEGITTSLVTLRGKHPTWGPKKLLGLLQRKEHRDDYPAISTAADILKRSGLIKAERRNHKRLHPGCPTTVSNQPNQIWTADYKGQFKMRNGEYCYPLTVCDMHSRYLLGCEAHPGVSLERTKQYFSLLFEQYGLPERIRTDNGVPFASSAIARLSALSVWWIKLGIYPELIEPGCPEQNGKHERMHRTLKKETTIPAEKNLYNQQERFDVFRKEYNTIRPHESLEMKTPAELYTPSVRKMPKKLMHYDYPSYFEVRLVSNNGGTRWHKRRLPVSQTLAKEYIGFEEIDNGIYNVYFCNLLIGRFFEELHRIKDIITRVPTRMRNVRVSPINPE